MGFENYSAHGPVINVYVQRQEERFITPEQYEDSCRTPSNSPPRILVGACSLPRQCV